VQNFFFSCSVSKGTRQKGQILFCKFTIHLPMFLFL
jgi:hypothetical protein